MKELEMGERGVNLNNLCNQAIEFAPYSFFHIIEPNYDRIFFSHFCY